jgi:hypothetical protein
VRTVKHVAREYFPGDRQRERDDQPGKELADPGAQLVDEQQCLLPSGQSRLSACQEPEAEIETATRLAPEWLG